jgi:hypothetical protein
VLHAKINIMRRRSARVTKESLIQTDGKSWRKTLLINSYVKRTEAGGKEHNMSSMEKARVSQKDFDSN